MAEEPDPSRPQISPHNPHSNALQQSRQLVAFSDCASCTVVGILRFVRRLSVGLDWHLWLFGVQRRSSSSAQGPQYHSEGVSENPRPTSKRQDPEMDMEYASIQESVLKVASKADNKDWNSSP